MIAQAVLSSCLIAGARFYQVAIRPVLPGVCRFQPSCSDYFIQAVRQYGPVRGAWKGIGRICRCGPWSSGGYDPP
jgi:putative membrane protein insertion efficiency factor